MGLKPFSCQGIPNWREMDRIRQYPRKPRLSKEQRRRKAEAAEAAEAAALAASTAPLQRQEPLNLSSKALYTQSFGSIKQKTNYVPTNQAYAFETKNMSGKRQTCGELQPKWPVILMVITSRPVTGLCLAPPQNGFCQNPYVSVLVMTSMLLRWSPFIEWILFEKPNYTGSPTLSPCLLKWSWRWDQRTSGNWKTNLRSIIQWMINGRPWELYPRARTHTGMLLLCQVRSNTCTRNIPYSVLSL